MNELVEKIREVVAPEIEVYKLYVATAENNIERRLKMNQYYYSVVVAIFIAYAYLAEGKLNASLSASLASLPTVAIIWGLPAFLLIVSAAWLLQLHSARRLTQAKYSVIAALERDMLLKPFDLEWQAIRKQRGVPRGSTMEMIVPALFVALSLLGLVAPTLWLAR
jgi:hypothetical protein